MTTAGLTRDIFTSTQYTDVFIVRLTTKVFHYTTDGMTTVCGRPCGERRSVLTHYSTECKRCSDLFGRVYAAEVEKAHAEALGIQRQREEAGTAEVTGVRYERLRSQRDRAVDKIQELRTKLIVAEDVIRELRAELSVAEDVIRELRAEPGQARRPAPLPRRERRPEPGADWDAALAELLTGRLAEGDGHSPRGA